MDGLRRSLLKRIAALPLATVVGRSLPGIAAEDKEDHRAWQHGVDLLRVGGRLLLVWGSPGNPPRPNLGGDWQHDVYYALIDSEVTPLEPRVLVARDEAQEPPSTAINSRGTILMTCEDGEDGIHQKAGLWDAGLRVRRNYGMMIRRGGHSGHVAAVGDRFLVAYSEGWVEGGGFLDRGTGKDVYARIVEDDGTLRREVKLTGSDPAFRDGWPLVAGSERNWLMVWQRYPAMTLQAALIDAKGEIRSRLTVSGGLPIRYAYDVGYSRQTGTYVVAGSTGEAGFVSLIGVDGKLLGTARDLPPIASESRIVLGGDGRQAIGAYPVRGKGVAVVRLSDGKAEVARVIDHPYEWDYAGTTGTFVAPDRVLFATLSKTGIRVFGVPLG